MKELEDELRCALARREPPAGFAERVLERACAPSARTYSWRERFRLAFPRRQLAWGVSCLLLLVLLAGAGAEFRRYRQGEMAKRQVMAALRIAGAEWNSAREKIYRNETAGGGGTVRE